MAESTALRLANLIDHGNDSSWIEREAAAELRRLAAVNQELLEALKHAHTWLQGSEPGRAQYLGEVIAKVEGA
jgi:hypothetical protein